MENLYYPSSDNEADNFSSDSESSLAGYVTIILN
jgi:hypothetical protein